MNNVCWVCGKPFPPRRNRRTCPRSVSVSCYTRSQTVTLRGHMPTEAEAMRLWHLYRIRIDPTDQARLRERYNAARRLDARKDRRKLVALRSTDDDDGEALVALATLPEALPECDCHVHSPISNAAYRVHTCAPCGGTAACKTCGNWRNAA